MPFMYVIYIIEFALPAIEYYIFNNVMALETVSKNELAIIEMWKALGTVFLFL